MGNVRFGGPRLADVLRAAKVDVQPTARFVTAEGADKPAKPSDDFEHSLPLDDVLARSIVALRMNDEPLPALHGGPVRLVTPGYYGTMNVKWLTRLRFEDQETHNHHQAQRYRTPKEPIKPGTEFKYELKNSEPNWRMRIKSVIFTPEEGQRLAQGETEVTGVAFNDGLTPIEGVYVSTDGGAAWQRAEMEKPAGPFAWHRWKIKLNLKGGHHQIMARAVDAQGRTQPLDGSISWNPAGYAYNGVHVVGVDVVG
jgi:DMSO/TMAO reductase YedYZ molybdopterin-dependent catalytic subunit